MPLRIFISTGEVSGDLQGALLIEALHRAADRRGLALEILALGGPRMAAAGAQLLADTSAIGSVGLWESLPYVGPTLSLQARARRVLRDRPPGVAVAIDYLGPNLAMGDFLRRSFPQVPVLYYIAPQEWVWSLNGRDTRRIVRNTDRLLAIFPEEARYYREKGADVLWVGHPLVDRLAAAPSREAARAALGIAPDDLAIALIPASRRQELRYLLPVLLAAARKIQERRPQVRFWVPLSLARYRRELERAIAGAGLSAELVAGEVTATGPTGSPRAVPASIACLRAADAAIAKSGTVNLEAALLGTPQVVAYRVSPITAWIARHLLRFSIPYMSPPNLVEMKPIVPEFLQDEATPAAIAAETLALLEPERRDRVKDDYAAMTRALGGPGACDRAAEAILEAAPNPDAAIAARP